MLVGVLNVTPDSFSDGGDHATAAAAHHHGLRLAADGAALVDVGGESTRPGARRVDAPTECRRVLPVVRALVAAGVGVSIDTTRAEVAAAAVEAGAALVNDVSGGLADPAMLDTVAALGVPYVAMHWRGHSDLMTPDRMGELAAYDDVVEEVGAVLQERATAARRAGIRDVVLDPGLGFAKTGEHNWALLRALPQLVALGPVLVGASRKRFLGDLLGGRAPKERDTATAAITLLAAEAGVWGVRVHDVRASADALAVRAEMQR